MRAGEEASVNTGQFRRHSEAGEGATMETCLAGRRTGLCSQVVVEGVAQNSSQVPLE